VASSSRNRDVVDSDWRFTLDTHSFAASEAASGRSFVSSWHGISGATSASAAQIPGASSVVRRVRAWSTIFQSRRRIPCFEALSRDPNRSEKSRSIMPPNRTKIAGRPTLKARDFRKSTTPIPRSATLDLTQ